MGATLQGSDSGAVAYEYVGTAAEMVGRTRNALGSVTAAKPLSLLELILPPLAFLKAGGQLNADLSTASARNATASRLGDLELALAQAADAAAACGDNPIGDGNAAAWNNLLRQAESAGPAIANEIARVNAAARTTNTITEAPGKALESLGLGGAKAVEGAGAGLGAGARALAWIARNLVWLVVGGAVVTVGVLLLLKIPQRWLARRRKG